MAILNNSNAISSGGYDINNSLRFRASNSARLSRTFGTTGTNNKIQTFSAWVKRGLLSSSTTYRLIGCYDGSSANSTEINFNNDNLRIEFGGAANNPVITTQVFRDPSAWYHIVIAIDTTQATASNRVKMYVNGTQVTAFSTATYPAQNAASQLTSANANNSIGAGWSGFEYFDGYMTEINFVDGQALTPSSFGSTNATTGVWQPAQYTGTYGTNGFYLKFADASAATAAAIGKDSSGNGNNWTPSGISVTAGTTYDAMLDVPTNTSATVANYCTWNPLDALTASTFQNGNLQITTPSAGGGVSRATMGLTGNKFYWEVVGTTNGNYLEVGILKSTDTSASYLESQAGGYSYLNNGQKCNNGTAASYGNSYTTNDVIGVAFDATTGSLYFSKNGTWQNSGDPVAGTGYAYTGLTADTYMPAISDSANTISTVASVNFGQRPFSYTPPSGFVALNTYNLPDSTIKKGNAVMDATTYTGTGASLAITNAGAFKPDLVWIKARSQAYNNGLFDSVRGTTKELVSNSTGGENTASGLTAFNSNGFTLGTNPGFNENASTFVGWQWQAGQGTTSSNTSGTITSTVSVNTTAGFSVVTYTGTGANATVGHGLGVAPSMIIAKSRSVVADWNVYHTSLGATKALFLNRTIAADTNIAYWNNTSPTSSVFSLGITGDVNTNASTNVAYCWAEIAGFSKFGSYTGNGSADGPFIFTNFQPKWIMFKKTTTGLGNSNWWIYDAVRNTYNVATFGLLPNSSVAEQTNSTLDILSNGFKLRNSNGEFNDSSQPFIYAAFASNPFKNSNAY